jgi:hypothetical protein
MTNTCEILALKSQECRGLGRHRKKSNDNTHLEELERRKWAGCIWLRIGTNSRLS